MFPSLFDWINRLPQNQQGPVIQVIGGIFSALLAFVGVLIGLAINRKKQRQDHALALRKDCYIAVLKHIVQNMAMWMQFAPLREPPPTVSDLQSLQAWLRLVADENVTECETEAVEMMLTNNKASHRARAEITALNNAASQQGISAEERQKRVSAFQARQDALVVEMLAKKNAFNKPFNKLVVACRLSLGLKDDSKLFKGAKAQTFEDLEQSLI